MSRGGSRYGAGRPGWRRKTDSCLCIDVRQQVIRSSLVPYAAGSWTWRQAGQVVAQIGYQVQADQLRLSYASNGVPSWQLVPLQWTACRFGGRRPWLCCPACSLRVLVLYFHRGRFACRSCQRLAYPSQSEDSLRRLVLKRERLEQLLFPEDGTRRRYRQATRDRLLDEYNACDEVINGLFVQYLQRHGVTL